MWNRISSTKTFRAAVITIIGAVASAALGWVEWSIAIQTIAGAVLIITGRDAVAKIPTRPGDERV